MSKARACINPSYKCTYEFHKVQFDNVVSRGDIDPILIGWCKCGRLVKALRTVQGGGNLRGEIGKGNIGIRRTNILSLTLVL